MKSTKQILKKYSFLLALLIIGCKADLSTKQWAANALKNNASVEVVPSIVKLTYVENFSVSFGFLSQIPVETRIPLIFSIALSACCLIVFILFKWRNKRITDLLPLVLILSGAIGNIWDRFANGYVIDFIHFHYTDRYNFPVFNIADTLIFCGTMLFIYQNFQQNRRFSTL